MTEGISIFQEGGKLAELLARRPELYTPLNETLRTLRLEGIGERRVLEGIDLSIRTLEEAQRRARDSDFYCFRIYDSWSEGSYGDGDGYNLFKLVNGTLVCRLDELRQTHPRIEGLVDILKKERVVRVYTLDIDQEAYGLKADVVDGDGDSITHSALQEEDIIFLKSKGIEVVVTPQPLL